jgi:hypothetical protein
MRPTVFLVAATLARAAIPPPFSWDTVPLFFHSTNESGLWSAAALERLRAFPIITMDKGQGLANSSDARPGELRALDAARAIRAAVGAAPTILFYQNSMIDWPMYSTHAAVTANPALRLHNATGGEALYLGNWVFDVGSVDAGAGALAFARGGWQEGRGGGIRAQPFFVEGEAAALDAPGEWWVDPATATLHLWPNASDGAPPALLVLPVLETLVAVGAGAPGVTLAGLAFQHTVDGLMEPYSVPEAGDWSLRLAGAVEVAGAAGTTLTGCAWQRTGGNGLLVTGAARDTAVEDCEFYLQGSSAIAVVGSAPYANATAAAAAAAAYPSGVRILRALVEGVGVLGKQSSALFVSVACGVVLQDSVLYSCVGGREARAARCSFPYPHLLHPLPSPPPPTTTRRGPRAGVNLNDGFCGGSRIEGSVLFDWVRETRACGARRGSSSDCPFLDPHQLHCPPPAARAPQRTMAQLTRGTGRCTLTPSMPARPPTQSGTASLAMPSSTGPAATATWAICGPAWTMTTAARRCLWRVT